MLKISMGNCYKCDLETVVNPNNSKYFCMNRRDLEIKSKHNWQVIFVKHKDSLRQKYRKESTGNIRFQSNKIFVRNDLFEEITKNCKITNLQFLKLKEKLGLCLYRVICDEQKSEEIFTQHDIENEQSRKNNVTEDATIKKSIKKPVKIKSLKKDVNTTDYPNWFDKNKFEKNVSYYWQHQI